MENKGNDKKADYKENNENRENFEISKYGIMPTTTANENKNNFWFSKYSAEEIQFHDFFEELGPKNQKIPSFGIFPESNHHSENFDTNLKSNFDNYNDNDDNSNNNNCHIDNIESCNNNGVNSVMMDRWKVSNVHNNESKYDGSGRSEHASSTYNIGNEYVRDGLYVHSDNSYSCNSKNQRINSKSRIAQEVEREVERESRNKRVREIIENDRCRRNSNEENNVVERGSDFLITLRPSFSLTSDENFSPQGKRRRERGRDSGGREWEMSRERERGRSRERGREDDGLLIVRGRAEYDLLGRQTRIGATQDIKQERGLLKFN